ncbi:hypothetical protein ADUPG1_002162, partial [Aduncisulcus paluster]
QMTAINEKVSGNTGWIDENRQIIREMKEAPGREHDAYKRAFAIAVITSFATSLVGIFIGKGL